MPVEATMALPGVAVAHVASPLVADPAAPKRDEIELPTVVAVEAAAVVAAPKVAEGTPKALPNCAAADTPGTVADMADALAPALAPPAVPIDPAIAPAVK